MFNIKQSHRWDEETCDAYLKALRSKTEGLEMACSIPLLQHIAKNDGVFGVNDFLKKYYADNRYEAKNYAAQFTMAGLFKQYIMEEIRLSGISYAFEAASDFSYYLDADRAGTDFIFELTFDNQELYQEMLAYIKDDLELTRNHYESYVWSLAPDHVKEHFFNDMIDYLDITNENHRHFINRLIESSDKHDIVQLFQYSKLQNIAWLEDHNNINMQYIFHFLGLDMSGFDIPVDSDLFEKRKMVISPYLSCYTLDMRAHFMSNVLWGVDSWEEHVFLIEKIIPEYAHLLPELQKEISPFSYNLNRDVHDYWMGVLTPHASALFEQYEVYKNSVEDIKFDNYIKLKIQTAHSEMDLFIM